MLNKIYVIFTIFYDIQDSVFFSSEKTYKAHAGYDDYYGRSGLIVAGLQFLLSMWFDQSLELTIVNSILRAPCAWTNLRFDQNPK